MLTGSGARAAVFGLAARASLRLVFRRPAPAVRVFGFRRATEPRRDRQGGHGAIVNARWQYRCAAVADRAPQGYGFLAIAGPSPNPCKAPRQSLRAPETASSRGAFPCLRRTSSGIVATVGRLSRVVQLGPGVDQVVATARRRFPVRRQAQRVNPPTPRRAFFAWGRGVLVGRGQPRRVHPRDRDRSAASGSDQQLRE